MSKYNANLLKLQLQSALLRLEWTKILVLTLCTAGIVAWFFGIPHLRGRLDASQHAIEQAQLLLLQTDGPAPAVQRSETENRLALFHETLGEKRYVEQQVKTLFSIAGKSGLTLSQAEYKAAFDKNGRFHTYQIQLPVKGPYGAIRQFCEQTLLAIPFASLDEMNFKRESITSPVLEAKLRFTLYLDDVAVIKESFQ